VEPAHLALGLDRAPAPGLEADALRLDQRHREAVGVAQREDRLAEASAGLADPGAVALEPLAPEAEAAGWHGQRHLARQPVSGARRRQLRPGEEGEVGAGAAGGIGVEEVVGAGIVLVDALLDQPHAEHAGVEVEVLLRGARDRGDVVEPAHSVRFAQRSTSIARRARERRERRAYSRP
jgi:hypothetical protein